MDLPEGFVLDNQQQQTGPSLPEGFELDAAPETPEPTGKAEKAVNLGLTAAQGLTWGYGPKAMSAIGAGIAKPVLETGEAINNLAGGDYEAPSYGKLYNMGVSGYQDKVNQSREDNPILSAVAEGGGAIASGVGLAKTGLGKGINNWVNGARPLTAKALAKKTAKSALVAEGGYRAYKAGVAAPGEELDEATTGAPVGAIAGGMATPVGAGLGWGASRLAPVADDALKETAGLARKYNIPLSMDQIAQSKPMKTVQKISQELPFSGTGGFRDEQMKAFHKAIAKTFGSEADSLTPEVIDEAFDRVGKKFNTFSKGKSFDLRNGLKTYLDDMVDEVSAFSDDAQAEMRKQLDLLEKQSKDGIISGEALSHQRARYNKLAAKAGKIGNTEKAELFRDLENFTIDLMTSGDDAAKAALKEAKKEYKNLLVIEPMKKKAGQISPAQLDTRARRIYGRAYNRGKAGEMGDLARIGTDLLIEQGGSDTFQKSAFTLAGLGLASTNPVTAPMAAKAAVGLTGNRAYQKWFNQNQDMIQKMLQDEFMKSLPKSKTVGAIGTTAGALTE